MDEDRELRVYSAVAILIGIMLLPLLLVGIALVEEIAFGSVKVSSLYRTPIDWLIVNIQSRMS
jgi:hypothetical protein